MELAKALKVVAAMMWANLRIHEREDCLTDTIVNLDWDLHQLRCEIDPEVLLHHVPYYHECGYAAEYPLEAK